MLIPVETLTAFFLASILLALVPGPDNIFVLAQSAVHGRSAGLIVTLGLCTGLIVHTTAVALGVAAIFQASAAAFTTLKLIGAGYLLYLAWKAFQSAARKFHTDRSTDLRNSQLYVRGIVMNITNPKVSIFFLAFLPQFADPARNSLTVQLMVLGGTFIVATLIVFGGIALLAGTLGVWLNRSVHAQRRINQVAGTVFVVLALKLAMTSK